MLQTPCSRHMKYSAFSSNSPVTPVGKIDKKKLRAEALSANIHLAKPEIA